MTRTTRFWNLVREEPYRILFPVGIFAGLSGAFHWVHFGIGGGRWNVPLHAGLQIPAYLGLFAAGFLATAVPRFTGTRPASGREAAWLGVLAAGVVGAPAFQDWRMTGGAFLLLVGFLGFFLVRRRRAAMQVPPGVFPWAWTALGFAAIGAGHFVVGLPGGMPWMAQGFGMALILATAPLVGHRILEHAPGPGGGGRRIPFGPVAFVLALSFAIESWSPAGWSREWVLRSSYALRGLALLGAFAWSGLLAPPGRWIPHAAFFWIAILGTAAGPIAAAVAPAHRAGLLHITLIGGFSLMMLMVATRVTLVHGGERGAVERPYLPATVYGLLVIAAAVLRVAAEFVPGGFGWCVALSASSWCLAHILFALFPGRRLFSGPGH